MKTSIPLFLILAAATAQAGPTVQSLKDEPATLFDLGMFRLELSFAHSQESIESLYSQHAQANPIASWASVSYSVRDEMIRVDAGFMDEQSSDEQMEAGCREVLRMWRIGVSKTAWRFFAHYGEEGHPTVQPMGPDLYDRIILRCYVSGNSTADGRFWATMPLRGDLGEDDGFNIGRWRMDNE